MSGSTGCSGASEVTDWSPIRVPAASTLVATAHQLRSRVPEHRYDDVLVDLDGGALGRVSAAAVFDGLAQQFSFRATHDELTGLVNRTHFLDLLTAWCADGGRGDRVVLAVVDLDGMKRINDSHGHSVGDAVLQRVAGHLSCAARPGDVVARLGADEFVVLRRIARSEAAPSAGEAQGQRLRMAIAAPDGAAHPATGTRASVGVAVSGEVADPTTLLSEADMAMFRAKQAGGDRVEVTTEVESDLALNVDLVDRSVAQAIEQGELRVYYQPVVRIADGRLTGIEALVRWAHPTMGLLTPDRFLPGARRAGHLPALDRWVLTTACTDMMALHRDLGPRAPSSVAVNLAPATLDTDFDTLVESVLARTGLPPNRLHLELPEHADLGSLTAAAPRLERLRRSGISLILDDMGAGSTSLRHLSTLTIAGLKIDAAFVNGMVHNPRDHTVVKLLADLGRGLNMPVIAEGVESAEQLAALTAIDIEYGQGFHLGRPQLIDQLVAQLEPTGRHRAGATVESVHGL